MLSPATICHEVLQAFGDVVRTETILRPICRDVNSLEDRRHVGEESPRLLVSDGQDARHEARIIHQRASRRRELCFRESSHFLVNNRGSTFSVDVVLQDL